MGKIAVSNKSRTNIVPAKKKYSVIIGIDPDVEASGYAAWDTEFKNLFILETINLWDLFKGLKWLHEIYFDKLLVRLEAGHKVKSTWHKGGNGMAKRVGANHEIGRQIEKFCKEHGIDLQLVAPQGYSSYNHEKFCKVTSWPIKSKTNPEKRVAGLLVYGG